MIFKSSRIISLIFFAALILIPSLIVVLGSFKTDSEVYNKPLSLPENWNLDNFGPLKIPTNKIFVSEDTRIISEDSKIVWKIVLLIVMIVTFLIKYKI